MNNFVPDSACKQGKCANVTTGCQNVCWLTTPAGAILIAPAHPVVTNLSAPIPTWQERCTDGKHNFASFNEARDAEIADLRAALRSQPKGEAQ